MGLRKFALAHPRTPLRRQLVDAVLRGSKKATASLLTDYVPHTEEPLPIVGERYRIVGFDDETVGMVETTELLIVPAGKVDLQFVRDEGEGFDTVADWRTAHERFWSDRKITDETPIVCERFRLVDVLTPRL